MVIKLNLSEKEINKIKEDHFENLYNDNKFKGNSFSLKKSLDDEISKPLNSTEFKDLLEYLKINIKDIIMGEPQKLEEFIEEIKQNHSIINKHIQEKYSIDKAKNNKNLIYSKKIREIFNYKGFSAFTNYKSSDLIKKLDISVCLYCNRNYIFTSENINTCELDHFYSQEKYPYLALSFYNLIPSCHTCNHKKSNKDFFVSDNIHPYIESFENNVCFSYNVKNTDIMNKENITEIYISENISSTANNIFKKANKNFDDLKLKEIYSYHKDIIVETYNKKQILNTEFVNSYLNYKYKDESGNELSIFKDKNVFLDLLLNISKDNMSNKPLSKFISDIYEKMSIVDNNKKSNPQ